MNGFSAVFEPLIDRVNGLIGGGRSVTVAIDGNSGAGKSTLAAKFKSEYDCNIFHMDDFFLQPFQRTPQRLSETGGNIDYERFSAEVLTPLRTGKRFSYRKYDCGTCELGDKIAVEPKSLNIVEGVYCLHPSFGGGYDVKVFLKVDKGEQLRRLKARNAELYSRFINEWLPMEEAYFNAFNIAENCDYIINN